MWTKSFPCFLPLRLSNHLQTMDWSGQDMYAQHMDREGWEVGGRDMGWEVLWQQWVILKVPSQSGAEERPPKAWLGHRVPKSESRIHNKPHREGVKEDYWILLQAVSSQELETGANWQWLWFPEPGVGRSRGNKIGLWSCQQNLSHGHRMEAQHMDWARADVNDKGRAQVHPDRLERSVLINSVHFCAAAWNVCI